MFSRLPADISICPVIFFFLSPLLSPYVRPVSPIFPLIPSIQVVFDLPFLFFHLKE